MAAACPDHRGLAFAPVLCYRAPGANGDQGELQLLEREAVLETVVLNLLAEPIQLLGFHLAEQSGTLWDLYLDGKRLRVGKGDEALNHELDFGAAGSSIGAEDLARWLAAELQHPGRNLAHDVKTAHLRAYALACVNHLVHEQRIALVQLARQQHRLVRRLAEQIDDLRDKASKRAFNQLVLDGGWTIRASAAHAFSFEAGIYPVPAHKRYVGKFHFHKHYFALPADLQDGGQEWACAVALNQHARVRHWVRNLESDPVAGFWLPTSFGRFYPDFVCELHDGRLLVAEYKGAHLRSMPKEIEKAQVGALWAASSGSSAIFAMLFKQERGMGLAEQIDAVLDAATCPKD